MKTSGFRTRGEREKRGTASFRADKKRRCYVWPSAHCRTRGIALENTARSAECRPGPWLQFPQRGGPSLLSSTGRQVSSSECPAGPGSPRRPCRDSAAFTQAQKPETTKLDRHAERDGKRTGQRTGAQRRLCEKKTEAASPPGEKRKSPSARTLSGGSSNWWRHRKTVGTRPRRLGLTARSKARKQKTREDSGSRVSRDSSCCCGDLRSWRSRTVEGTETGGSCRVS